MSNAQTSSGLFRSGLDKAGIVVSAACALHCVATIILVSALGIGGQFLLAEEIHHIALAIAIVIAVAAIGGGALLHRRREPFLIAIVGLAFMVGALASGHGIQESVLTIIGVAVVSFAHVLNIRSAH